MLIPPCVEPEDDVLFDDDTVAICNEVLDFSSSEGASGDHARLANVWEANCVKTPCSGKRMVLCNCYDFCCLQCEKFCRSEIVSMTVPLHVS